MAGNLENDVNGIIYELFRMIGQLIKGIFQGIWYGIKKLRNRKLMLAFLSTFLIAEVTWLFHLEIMDLDIPVPARYGILAAGLGMPVWFLVFIGGQTDKKQAEYRKIFERIGFRAKDNSLPVYAEEYQDGKLKVLVFQSVIPLQEWRNAKSRLETGLDCNILKIEYGKGKRIIKVTTVPSECVIPEKILWRDNYTSSESGIMTVGQGALKNITFNLNRTPHVLIAGETGSGKSVILRCLLWQMICQGARVYMFDFKGGVEFGKQYEKYGEVVTDRKRALEILEALFYENQYRLTVFRDLEVKNLPEYNKKTGQNLCRIGLFCDEIGEMMDKKGIAKEEKELFEKIEGRLSSLARLSRATGINLFLGVQRPDANILPGQIKNNIPVRISGRFADKAASEIVLGNTDANNLPDIKGRFLYRMGNEIVEFQAYLFEDDVLKEIQVDPGEMLTESPGYTAEQVTGAGSTEPKEKRRPARSRSSDYADHNSTKGSVKKIENYDYGFNEKDSEEVEELLRQMDEYDLNNLF